jgi:Tol biopolymer transport system component
MFVSVAPDDKTVVFDSGGEGIYRVAPGREADQLTAPPPGARDSTPRWSPDGRLIAFGRHAADGREGIWTMAPDGADPRLVVEGTGLNVMFTWMPDASGLVYIGRDRQLHLRQLAGGTDRVLTDEKELMPIAAVSPDGKWLVYQVVVNGNVDLHAVPMEGGAASVVVHTPGADYHPSFSPTGRWLYFQPDHRNVWRIPGPAQGWRQAPPEQVTHFVDSGLWLEDPQVSFDGRALVYSRAHIESNLWLLKR